MLDDPLLRRIGNVYTLVALGGLVIGALKALGVVALVGVDPVGVGVIAVSAALLVFGLVRGGKPRPLTDGEEGEGSREPKEPTGVLADIEHRDGCPRNLARMETWKQTRERDGIEVTVGKCNDCGRMAYRHGDAPPSSPPASAPPRAPSESKPKQPPQPTAESKAQRLALPTVPPPPPLPSGYPARAELARKLRVLATEGDELPNDPATSSAKQAEVREERKRWAHNVRGALERAALSRHADWFFETPELTVSSRNWLQTLGTARVRGEEEIKSEWRLRNRLAKLRRIIAQLEEEH